MKFGFGEGRGNVLTSRGGLEGGLARRMPGRPTRWSACLWLMKTGLGLHGAGAALRLWAARAGNDHAAPHPMGNPDR